MHRRWAAADLPVVNHQLCYVGARLVGNKRRRDRRRIRERGDAPRWTRDERPCVRAFPSTSDEPPPFNVTVEPIATVWLGPASATGGEFVVLNATVAVSLPNPLLTVSPAM